MKKSLHLVVSLLCMLPILYLLIIYPNLPDTVAMHFDLNGKPDDWGPKKNIWIMMLVLVLVTAAVYILLCNAHRLDPMKKAIHNKARMQKMGVAVVLFITVIQLWLIRTIQNEGWSQEPKIILVAIGILFAIIGNYMDNIKPNYFAGLRLPWTLKNEENWRKTHHYASRLWFAGGLFIAVCCLFLPLMPGLILLFSTVLIMTLIPAVYSYQLYKKNNQNFSS